MVDMHSLNPLEEVGTIADLERMDWRLLSPRNRLTEEAAKRRFEVLQRLTNLAAAFAGAEFAQLSLVGDTQYVPASTGLTYSLKDQFSPAEHSLCSVTVSMGEELAIPDAKANGLVRNLPPVSSGLVGSYFGVPVTLSDGTAVGAICAFDTGPRQWDESLSDAMADLAVLAGRELERLELLERHEMQVSTLTEVVRDLVESEIRLEQHDGISATGRYRAASPTRMGGDWYDSCDTGDAVTFILGDVAGHGIGAVSTMVKLRTAVRAYVLAGDTPATALQRTSRMLANDDPTAVATVAAAQIDALTGTISIASAGHVPPILLRNGQASLLEAVSTPPLGYVATVGEELEHQLRAGDRVLMYSDGVVETRTESLDVSIGRLLRTLETTELTEQGQTLGDVVLDADIGTNDDDACVLVISYD